MERIRRLWQGFWECRWMTRRFRTVLRSQSVRDCGSHCPGSILGDVHPNSVKLELTGESGRTLEVIAASIGGGRIEICEIDGLTANFSGDYPTLIVHNIDQPGHVTEVTSMLAHKSVNIATMQLYRASRGGNAVMVIECDQEIPADALKWLERMEGILKVTYLSLL